MNHGRLARPVLKICSKTDSDVITDFLFRPIIYLTRPPSINTLYILLFDRYYSRHCRISGRTSTLQEASMTTSLCLMPYNLPCAPRKQPYLSKLLLSADPSARSAWSRHHSYFTLRIGCGTSDFRVFVIFISR
jgi:hypothetical protein